MKKQIFVCTLAILGTLLCACEDAKPAVTTADVVTTTENNMFNSNYTIENGVLLAYTGNETEITIPDSVTEIADSAFANAPQITSVYLGKNVQTISPKAFRTLELLNTVTLAPENTHFIIDSHFLIKSDYTQFF